MGKYSRFLKPYYIINSLSLLFYPAVRHFSNLKTPKTLTADEFLPAGLQHDREIQVLGTVAILLAVRFFKAHSFDEFVLNLFRYLKLSFLILLALMNIWVSVWYAFILIVIWVIFPIPLYDGPSKFIDFKSMSEFLSKVLESDHNWVILFYADWHETCITTMPLWADLSNRYTTSQLHFGKVEVDRLPAIAEKCLIDTSGISRQLPSIIVYQKGVEYKRFPVINERGVVGRVLKYSVKEIVTYMEIDRLYLSTRD